jgi:hypothetical protein
MRCIASKGQCMFRSVDGCASSSGRRRDADQEKDEERLYENRS